MAESKPDDKKGPCTNDPENNKLNRRPAADHRLRGNEFAADFADADADSSGIATHRDDKVSES